nr:PAAR-like protein [uncultured Prevotella sp.]
MAQSYIPAGTDVICTEMTGGEPAQLGLTREAKVLYGKEKKPLLNICDKKLSCSLQCRIKQSFFSGLGGLLTGLALGALAVTLVVITAGAATPIIIAAMGATAVLTTSAAVAIGASATYRYLANECDSSLEGEWSLFHSKVYLEKSNALLERSILTCSKGGVVSLVMDHAKAVELAKMISETNDKIASKNMWSKFFQGVIGNGANALLGGFEGQAGGAVAAVVIGSGLSVYSYCTSDVDNYRDSNVQKQNDYAKIALETDDDQASISTNHDVFTKSDGVAVTSVGAGGIVASGGETVLNVIIRNKELSQEAMKQIDKALEQVLKGNLQAANEARKEAGKILGKQQGVNLNSFKAIFTGRTPVFKYNVHNGAFIGAGLAIGVLSAMWNNHIEGKDNEEENLLYEEMIGKIITNRKAKIGGISVTANSL